jgi:hypothetical protein
VTKPRQRRKSQPATLPANHPGDREPTPAVRPTREALVEALRLIANPAQPIAVDQTPDETGSYQQQQVTVPGWRLLIMWREGTILHLSQAWGPGGVHWEYGCDRWPDWAAGPEAAMLCPVGHLLTPLERAALERRLLAEPCTPPPQLPVNAPGIDAIMTDDYLGLFTP